MSSSLVFVRQVREEVGIETAGRVAFVGSQPWPIGRGGSSELMVGLMLDAARPAAAAAGETPPTAPPPTAAAADATTTTTIAAALLPIPLRVERSELQDAIWATRAEVRAAVARAAGASGGGTAAIAAGPEWSVPGPYAIAHKLLVAWLEADPDGPIDDGADLK